MIQRQTLASWKARCERTFQEEPDPEEHHNHPGTKEYVSAVANVIDHVGCAYAGEIG
jgi:hypothetical protein